jgi:magnesium transporter
LIQIFVHRDGRTEQVTSIDRAWLGPVSGAIVWVDLAEPSIPESLILSDTFNFHPLAVESALSTLQYPKIEPYDGFLYVVLHGIDFHHRDTPGFATLDVDFFLGRNFLVTVRTGHSRSVANLCEYAVRNTQILGEGPVALFHRIVDAMVDHYLPEVEDLEEELDRVEDVVLQSPSQELVGEILVLKRDVASLRRVTTPQRDVVGRLARREFVDISSEMSFRFRDVYDRLVRLNDDALIFHDRVTGILEAYLSNISNRLNQVVKVLTVITTVFMPLTLVTGLFGMNVELPRFPGGDALQFWWVFGLMAVVVAAMLMVFRLRRWI